jgi:hypothetical protein
MTSKNSGSRLRRAFPSPALVVAFVALFAAMGGFGYAAVKMKPNSVRSKNIKDGAITTGKIADGAVTTPKLAPDAVAPNATNAANSMNSARLGGVAPGGCQQGWIMASAVIDTRMLTDANRDTDVAGFDCASRAADAIHIHRAGIGEYELSLAGIDSAAAIASSALPNTVTSATKVQEGSLVVHVWSNTTGEFVDNTPFTLVVF